jgi:hypothetical protein
MCDSFQLEDLTGCSRAEAVSAGESCILRAMIFRRIESDYVYFRSRVFYFYLESERFESMDCETRLDKNRGPET